MAAARVRLSGSTGGGSHLENAFLTAWRACAAAARYPEPSQQFRFHPVRMWRMDFAWTAYSVYVEIDGGQFVHGRHNRGMGQQGDNEKQNEAVLDGWLPLKFTTTDINKDPIGCIEKVIKALERVKRTRAAMMGKA